jgi:hypothetical protein
MLDPFEVERDDGWRPCGPGVRVACKDGAVGETVEAVATDAVLEGELVREHSGAQSYRRVERGVEDGDHGDIGAVPPRRPDACEARAL